jgi:hypothetical protein
MKMFIETFEDAKKWRQIHRAKLTHTRRRRPPRKRSSVCITHPSADKFAGIFIGKIGKTFTANPGRS